MVLSPLPGAPSEEGVPGGCLGEDERGWGTGPEGIQRTSTVSTNVSSYNNLSEANMTRHSLIPGLGGIVLLFSVVADHQVALSAFSEACMNNKKLALLLSFTEKD